MGRAPGGRRAPARRSLRGTCGPETPRVGLRRGLRGGGCARSSRHAPGRRPSAACPARASPPRGQSARPHVSTSLRFPPDPGTAAGWSCGHSQPARAGSRIVIRHRGGEIGRESDQLPVRVWTGLPASARMQRSANARPPVDPFRARPLIERCSPSSPQRTARTSWASGAGSTPAVVAHARAGS